MIVYFDTSALVPLLIDEPTSRGCRELWTTADTVACTRLTYIEAAASIAMAERLNRLSADGVRDAKAILDRLWLQIQVIELGQDLMVLAADMALKHGLRGYDATHCAAAVAIKDVELVAASGDQRLLEAWRAEGLAVRDTHQR